MIRFIAKVFKDGESFSVEFPDLPGCYSEGKNYEDAKAHAKEALSLYLEEARDPKWKIPISKNRTGRGYEWITPSADVAIPLMIRQARLKHGLTQKQLAALLNISFQQIQKLETPRKSNPTVQTLVAISLVLNETLEIKLVA